MDENEQKNIAVLIDADNTPYKKLTAILQEIAVHGHIITKRAYGDFSLNTLKNWKNELNDNAIRTKSIFQCYSFLTHRARTPVTVP